MKKVMLVTVVLAFCGALHNSVLAQEKDRYLVTYWRSVVGNQIRSATVVTVVNQSDRVCNVQVEWFPSAAGNPVSISGPQLISPGAAFHFCSRNVSPLITTCSPQVLADPALPAQGISQGKAIVSSTDVVACSLIGVDARVYYTTGTNAAGDTAVTAISNSKIVFAGEGNLGD